MIILTVCQFLLVCFTVVDSQSVACKDPLGMESYVISDGQISASSQWDNNHAAIQGRLNFKAGSGKRGGWSSKLNDVNQWLQIDLGDPNTDVTGLATQGRNAHSQWVTKYKMQYSVDGTNFQYYVEQGAEKEFTGNSDQDTIVFHSLSNPITARYIRFRPTAWYRHISMRVEVYGCLECKQALGMKSGDIYDRQISASSEWDSNHAAIQGRLFFLAGSGKQGAWSARHNNLDQWLQIDLLDQITKVTAVSTQGRNAYSQWVTKYKLQYSVDGVNFQYYTEVGEKEFTGNTDRDSVVFHSLINPITGARYIRFRPTAWYGHISMRVEVYGCKETDTC